MRATAMCTRELFPAGVFRIVFHKKKVFEVFFRIVFHTKHPRGFWGIEKHKEGFDVGGFWCRLPADDA